MTEKPALPWWTWFLPILIFHLGTGLSLHFQVSQRMSLWYLPVPLGLILIQWWGPRILVGLFLNAMLCAGYWGLYRWWLWPLYALPETLKVGLSWWLFTRLLKGKAWLPDLSNTCRYLLFAVVAPSIIASLYGQGQMVLLGDAPAAQWWHTAYAEFVLDILCPFAITVPALLFGTSYLEKIGLSVTRGAYPRPALVISDRITRMMAYEAIALFGGLLALSLFVSLEKYWFVYGIFLIWAALRFGIGLASLGTMWTIFLAMLLPALTSMRIAASWLTQSDLVKVNLNLATLCFAALVVGRALSDVFQEIEIRKRSDVDLKASESKYRHLFESASDAIVLGDNGIFVECNERALEMFGVAREEFIGSESSRFFPALLEDGTEASKEIARLRSAAMAGESQFFEWTMKRLDGALLETELTFIGVEVTGKRLIMAVIRDITKRKSMERALAENERKYRTIFETATDTLIVAERGRIIDCNQAGLAMFGCTREELVGSQGAAIFPERQPDGSLSADGVARYRDAALAGAPQSFEWTHRRFDGTTFDTDSTINQVIIDNKPRILVGIRDISSRKRIERALVESEERFRQMAESIQEIFFLLDRATQTMLYVSPIAESILGVPLANIVERPLAINDYMHPEDRVRIGFFEDGAWYKRTFNEDFRFIRPDGATRWLRMRSFLIPDLNGKVYRVAGVIADITDYKTAQGEAREHHERLVQADKMNSLGQMVSGVAHEINNPNNLIMLNTDVLDTFWKHMRPVLRDHVERNPDWKLAGIPYGSAEGKYETLLHGVAGGAKRIKRIVDNLKDFARMDGGDLSESIALDKVIEASVGIVDNLIRKSTDRFTVTHGEDIPRIRGNFQKLEQVVINLITNACQALESRSKSIRIRTWYEKERNVVGIRVEDEGRGIPQELLHRVTDPFFTTKRDTGGTGLGLSVSYGIIREHNGIIEFNSEANRGTTVEIRLPVQTGTSEGRHA